MLKFSDDQVALFSSHHEDEFVERLRAYLVRCCPASHLPDNQDEQTLLTRQLVKKARSKGLAWESTLAEFARLSVFRKHSKRMVSPAALVGPDPLTADAYFSDNMRRARVLNTGRRTADVL